MGWGQELAEMLTRAGQEQRGPCAACEFRISNRDTEVSREKFQAWMDGQFTV